MLVSTTEFGASRTRLQLTSFGGLLEVAVHTHAGETENGGLNHGDGWFGCDLR
jgi:hypothetical protein